VTDLYKAALREGWDGGGAAGAAGVERGAERRVAGVDPEHVPAADAGEGATGGDRDACGGAGDRGRPDEHRACAEPGRRWMAYFSERDLFEITLFLADAHTGRIVRGC
jgi:hypothetical protein